MIGVKFGSYDSYNSWNLFLKEKPKISSPELQTYMVEIPGRNGQLDLTDSVFGGVKYKDREIKMAFLSYAEQAQWATIVENMMASLHGKKMQIVLPDDPNYYYYGRMVVEPDYGRHVLTVKVTATVEPYKTSINGGVKKL